MDGIHQQISTTINNGFILLQIILMFPPRFPLKTQRWVYIFSWNEEPHGIFPKKLMQLILSLNKTSNMGKIKWNIKTYPF
jgi:hypothetical protein